ncbi:glycosyltransferase [Pseudomonas sp. NBRC 111123]|uniref:glycosyltransferase n=1 Tax=Pseudomonas sp. NBRC 111123 TaxID=1661038 RepID=UPI0007615CF4|nr:glycosyltransferase [Pseudomonas sp. NBRC 111123]
MNIVNMMWAGGSPYMSIHKVHQQVLSHAGADARISDWLMLGGELCHGRSPARVWHMPQRVLKGKSFWRLLLPWQRMRLYRALREAQADVILLDGVGVARLVLPVLQRIPQLQAKVLFHGMTRLNANDVLLLNELPADRLSIAAVSQTLARSLERDIGRPVQTLRMAFDPQAFARKLLSCEQARQMLALPQTSGQVLGAVGRLVESKGFETLIKAFAKGAASKPDMRLVIVGDGPLRASLEAQVDELGLTGRVLLCGHHNDLQRLYRAFDWLLVPSRAEGLGLVVQEAVMADLPVVCSELPVFREQLQQEGCYLPVGNVEAWAKAIERCDAPSAKALAVRQREALAPEAAWQAFCDGAQKLLRG